MFELTGITLAFFGMLSFGLGDSLFVLPAKKYKEEIILFWEYFFILLISIVIVYISKNTVMEQNISWTILFPVLAGLSEVGGVFFLMKSLKRETLGVSIAIASAYPLISFLYNHFVFAESLYFVQTISIFSIIGGIIILSLTSIKLSRLSLNKNIFFAFCSFISWGLLTIFQKYSTFYYSDIDTTIIMEIGSGLIVVFTLLFLKTQLKVKFKYLGTILLIAVLLFLGLFFMNSALQSTKASIVVAIIGSSAMITNVIGFSFYKERLFKHQYLGILIIVVSLFCLNFFS